MGLDRWPRLSLRLLNYGTIAMGVERERPKTFSYSGEAHPASVERQKSGSWSVAIAVDFVVYLRDGREIHIRKQVRTRATEQRYRKPKQVTVSERT